MTRLVSFCLVTLLCLGVAAPALAYPPYIDPGGLVEPLNETVRTVIDAVLAWFGG